LARLGPHAERLQWTQTFYSQSPEERPAFPDRFFGCFNYDVDDRTGVIRFHFNNRDPEGPLREASMPERVAELARMFAHAREQFPNAKVVEGRSWLYGRDAYRRLFPDAYLRSLRLAEGSARLQGSSRWGQLIDHRGGVNSDLREMFLRNIAHLNINRIWEVFPLPTFSASAPLEVFCDHYGSAHGVPHPGGCSSQHGAAQNPLR
jgi:choline dehydrogenase-like flavoprotein